MYCMADLWKCNSESKSELITELLEAKICIYTKDDLQRLFL